MAGRFAMPRLPGGPARDLPPCSRAGHADHKVVKDGRYGSPPRQRFRCAGPDGFHRFVPELPRKRTHDGTCDACDSAVPAHRGPVTGRKYGFPVREVAAALVAVGVGASYQQAALRARARSDLRLLEGAWGGATVAEWLDVLAPFVLDAHAETSWPETLVLDSTRFMSRNVRTGSQRLAFTVLGAYGYPAKGHGRPRVWALAANHHARSVWPRHANAWKWVSAHADLVANQVAVRHLLPDHHSAAALDAHLGTVRDFLDSRSFVLRNARRTTTMLGLVRLHLNGVDNTRRYSELLRAHLDARGGVAPEQRNGYDTDTSVHLPRAEQQPASLRR